MTKANTDQRQMPTIRRLLTRNQALVLDVLESTGKAMGAYDILDFTRPEGVNAPPQIYRALEKLHEVGLVHRLDSINAYLICQDHPGHQHEEVAFAICDSCRAVAEIPVPKLGNTLKAPLTARGFTLREAHLEILGECEACAGKRRRAAKTSGASGPQRTP